MSTTDRTERVAIVGIGGIFPGAPDLGTFWKNIANGIDSGRNVPKDRWFLSPETAFDRDGPKPDRVYSTWGCFIEDFQFDPTGLNLDRNLLVKLDPLFHLGLHASRMACQDARGLVGISPDRVGVILGNIVLPTESTSAMCRDALGRTFLERIVGSAQLTAERRSQLMSECRRHSPRSDWHPLNHYAASLPAALIAEGLGLGGPAYTLDAACASSLYALKFACEELLAHRADGMLAGGMSRPDCQYTQMGFAQLKALSRRGRCAPLSAAADGLVVGEGAGVFVLKRLTDAIKSGDHIYGVIAGIGLSNDRGANLLAPHSEGQLRAMRSAYQQAGWQPSDVDLIECHATGTPVGDSVEIDSLHQLWEREQAVPGQCVIGGVKSNVGHLLTGAGAAGLMKVLLAIRHQTLPPTANYEKPATTLAKAGSPFRVLRQAEVWEQRVEKSVTEHGTRSDLIPRRATINAFGFGGINAHVLIEEFVEATSHKVSRTENGGLPISLESRQSSLHEPSLNIAIVGLAVQRGTEASSNINGPKHGSVNENNLRNDWGVTATEWYRDEVGSALDARQSLCNPISSLHLPLGEYRIPPLEMQDMLPQQQLMLKIAADALRDALHPDQEQTLQTATAALGNRTGVFIGIELDPNTTNFHLRWSIEELAPQWADVLGLVLTPTEMTEWVEQLKKSVGPPLTANRVMGNLGGIVASRLAREFNVGGPSFTISADENSGLRACEMAAHALRRGELDQALVGAVDLPCDLRSRLAAWRLSGRPKGTTTFDSATAFVLKRFEDAIADGDPIHAVITQIDSSNQRNSNSDSFNYAGSATGLLELATATDSLRHRILPGSTSDHWLHNRSDGSRRIRVLGRGVDGRGLAFELADRLDSTPFHSPKSKVLETLRLNVGLFVIDGDSIGELESGLDRLAELADSRELIGLLAKRWFLARPPCEGRQLAVSLVVKSIDEMPEVIRLAKVRLYGNSAVDGIDRRIFFSRDPLENRGRLAYVFPGSGNAFLGMGRELLSAFPEILLRQDAKNNRLKDQYRPELIWYGKSNVELLDDHKAMIFGQVAIGTGVCDLLARFGIQPSASLGYSLGESAALFGLRAWTDRDEMLDRMDAASLFGSDLVHPFNAARRAWNIPDGTDVPWVSGVIDRSADEVRAAIAASNTNEATVDSDRASRVYLLIVNTPNQCVIGGDRGQVERLVKNLSAKFVTFAAPSTVHCEILRQVESAYHSLHVMRTTAPAFADANGHSRPIDFYSTAWGCPYELTQESAAEAILAQAVNTIDFPRVIERAYADGIRVFLEIGPGSSCTRMIDEILDVRPHLARSVLPATANPISTFLELLAALIAERVPADLTYLYGDEHSQQSKSTKVRSNREIVTETGGPQFSIPSPPNGWRFQLRPITISHDFDENPIPVFVEDHPRRPSIEEKLPSLTNTKLFTPEPSGPNVMTQLDDLLAARMKAHETYLRVSAEAQRIMADQLELLSRLAGGDTLEPANPPIGNVTASNLDSISATETTPQLLTTAIPLVPPRSLSRPQCMEFAIGKIGRVLGELFAEIDQHPTRVRLPDEPLMLVDRILEIDGEPLSMTFGRVVTEHDIHPGAWYLDCNRIPTCIAVEAGQADLFLSGWLGIDFETKGIASYRLLDAVVTFHRELPGPGETIHYDIRINHFFRQGQTYLFRFEFDATINGQRLLTMREGCAGFFTEAELAGGKGIVHTALDRQPRPGKRSADWTDLVAMGVESYDDRQLMALRQGQLGTCFGPAFQRLSLECPVTIPGLTNDQLSVSSRRSKMWLIDRVLKLDPSGGKFGLGMILGELDIHPNDWFLTCHFCDDQVMPGTLMYECCMHTLRIFLLRMGWVGESGQMAYEPIPEVRSRLKCRGQVLASTKKVWYEITLKEIGYTETGTPYCLADALMYADGKPIVEITDMSVRLSGLTRDAIERLWSGPTTARGVSTTPAHGLSAHGATHSSTIPQPVYDRRPALFDTDRITAYAIGNPSDAFGERYRIFDSDRIIARLPGPPFQFLDRIVAISGCEQWVLKPGGEVVAQYDVPPDAWYFASNRQKRMPFAVLLETALQPCGWLAAYVGSALTSDIDVSFRNLGGTATQYRDVTAASGTLTTTVKMTRVSTSGGMIIQHYDFDLRCNDEPVYVGNTYFGFFSKASLINQIGIRDAKPFVPSPADDQYCTNFRYLDQAPFADSQFQMIDDVKLSLANGPFGNGFVIGTTSVDPTSWFFKAHFHQDPVVPGSLGLESFFQLVKFYAARRWKLGENAQFTTPIIHRPGGQIHGKHEWVYRGQVIPRDKLVTVTAVIKQVDDATKQLTAEGFLSIDGRIIYQMKEFSAGVQA